MGPSTYSPLPNSMHRIWRIFLTSMCEPSQQLPRALYKALAGSYFSTSQHSTFLGRALPVALSYTLHLQGKHQACSVILVKCQVESISSEDCTCHISIHIRRQRSTMARQNVRVSTAPRMVTTTVTTAISSRPLFGFLPSMPKLWWAGPGRFAGTSGKHLMKIEPAEAEGVEAKVKPCIDSMRTSSPTRLRPSQAGPSPGSPNQDPWIVRVVALLSTKILIPRLSEAGTEFLLVRCLYRFFTHQHWTCSGK